MTTNNDLLYSIRDALSRIETYLAAAEKLDDGQGEINDTLAAMDSEVWDLHDDLDEGDQS